MSTTTSYTTKNGIVFYRNSVPESNIVPIVFVHGMWGSALIFRFWLALCEILGIKAYSIELRGHGKVSNCANLGHMSVKKNYAKDVSAVITDEVGDCILIGWSMGGLICQLVAAENRHVKKLVLVASAAPAGILLRGKILLKMLKPRYLWAMLWRTSFHITPKDAEELMFNFGFDNKVELEKFISELNPESGLAARELATWAIQGKTIPCPVLVVGAEHDAITPVSLQREVASKYGAKYIQIPGASHAIMLQPGVRDETFHKIIKWVFGESMPRPDVA